MQDSNARSLEELFHKIADHLSSLPNWMDANFSLGFHQAESWRLKHVESPSYYMASIDWRPHECVNGHRAGVDMARGYHNTNPLAALEEAYAAFQSTIKFP